MKRWSRPSIEPKQAQWSGGSKMGPRAKFLVGLLLVLSVAVSLLYFIRGPVCAFKDSRDFATVYLAGRAWLKGLDPYDHSAFPLLWSEARGSASELPNPLEVPSLYPLTSIFLISLFATFPWHLARFAWLAVNLVALAVTIGMVSVLGGVRGWAKLLVLVTGTLLLCALHWAIGMGSPTIVAVALGVGSIFLGQIKRDFWAGIALGLCLCVKPHLGLPFFGYYLFVRRSAVLHACLVAVCVITLAALIRTPDSCWLWSWLNNVQAALNGGINDPTRANPLHWQLLNLSYPLHTFISSRSAVTLMVLFLVAGQVAIFAKIQRLDGTFPHDLPGLCCLAIISFFPIYHRHYDAVLLVLLIPLVIGLLSQGNDIFGRPLMYLLFMFVPSPEILKAIEQRPSFTWLADSWWWTTIIQPWQAWSLLAMSILSLGLMYSQRDRPNAGS